MSASILLKAATLLVILPMCCCSSCSKNAKEKIATLMQMQSLHTFIYPLPAEFELMLLQRRVAGAKLVPLAVELVAPLSLQRSRSAEWSSRWCALIRK